MTLCPNTNKACRCQPQDGVMCPFGPTPNDWKPWKEEAMTTPHDLAGLSDWLRGMASRFHHTYERLAPRFGYTTRPETRHFDPDSPNGRLMIAVCAELFAASPTPPSAAPQTNVYVSATSPATNAPRSVTEVAAPAPAVVKVVMPAMPTLPPGDCLPYSAIRYIAGYPESYVQQYAAERVREAAAKWTEALAAAGVAVRLEVQS
ncbi:MAG: hypothetical protein NVS1B6_19730 [Steroidobacteraceae bacterium]